MTRYLAPAVLATIGFSIVPQAQDALVAGRVVSAATGQPIAAARVSLSEADAGVGEATTDAAGRFEIRGIRSCRCRNIASASGYRNGWLNEEPLIGHTPIVVTAGTRITDIIIRLHRGGVIAGRVVDRAGEPVVAAPVRAFRRSGGAGNQLMSAAGRAMGVSIAADPRTETDDRGQYRLIGVEPGEYLVGAIDRTSITFAPASTSLAGATAVTVGVDEDRAGVNIRVDPLPSGAIAGRVTSAGSAGPPPVSVALQADPNVARLPFLTARLEADGRFAFTDVPVGRHVLLVRPGPVPVPHGWSRTPVVVTAGGTAEATITLRAGARVAGRVEPFFFATQIAIAPIASDPDGERAMTRMLSDGSFAFTGVVPGRYQWLRSQSLVSSYGPRSLLSVIVKGEDVTDVPMTISENAVLTDVRLVLSEGSVIAGTVRDSAGTITTAGAVVIVPVERAYSTEVSRRLRVVRADTNGYFEARSLPPGRYRVAHVVRLSTAQIWEPAFTATLAGAREITLAAGATQTVDLSEVAATERAR